MVPLRVLHVITGLEIGGAEGMLAALATAPGSDIQHHVVSLKSAGFHGRALREAGIAVDELGLAPRRPDPRALRHLVRLIRKLQPDIVQGWLYHGDLAALIGLALSGRRRTTRLIWGLRCSNLDMNAYGGGLRLARAVCARLSAYPDMVIANSHTGLAAHRDLGYRPRQTAIIHNGIDLERFAPDPGRRVEIRRALAIGEHEPVIAHVARLDPMKDHHTLLEALHLVPDVHCLAIGAGTKSLPDRPNLHRLGRRDDVSLILPAADLVVSSSAYGEGFSSALAEGMASGLSAVATDVGDAHEIVGDTGLIVPPRAADRLAMGIRSLLSETDAVRHDRGERSRRRIAENFSLARAVAEFCAAYRELCT
jgi:glycosyltransferase involved in cell wall biosynthesis